MRTRMPYLGRINKRKKRKHYIYKNLFKVLRTMLIIFRIDITATERNANQVGVKKSEFKDWYG